MSGLQEIRKKSRKSKIYTKFFFEFGQVIIVNITHPHSDKSQISFSLRVIELYIFSSGGGSSQYLWRRPIGGSFPRGKISSQTINSELCVKEGQWTHLTLLLRINPLQSPWSGLGQGHCTMVI